MDPRHERHTHAVEDEHWWYVGRRRILGEVLRSLALPSDARILDAGCGSGRNMLELAAFGTVTGLELADASVAVARARGAGEVVQGTLESMPFADARFDLATSLDVIEHLDDDRGALQELRRVVAPGGRLLVTVPVYPRLWSSHDVINQHRRRYTRATLLAAAADSGWRPLRTTHFNSVLLAPAIVARGFERLRPRAPEQGSDLGRTPASLNAVLRMPLAAEARYIATGRRLPAGLSLLAVFA